jgi:hypothetical protein
VHALATGSNPATVPESPFKIIKADNMQYTKRDPLAAVGADELGIENIYIYLIELIQKFSDSQIFDPIAKNLITCYCAVI